MDIKKMFSENMSGLKQMFSEIKDKKTRKKQIPNMLTLSRLLAPFLIIPCSVMGAFPLAFTFVGLFSITDLLDGYIARKYHLTSEVGKNLDALADKVFAGTLLLSLISTNPMFSITLFLELIIGSVNVVQAFNGHNPKSHMLGKVKATFLYVLVALGFGSIYLDIPKLLIVSLFLTTSALQIQSVKKYCKADNGKKQIEKNDIENKLIENNADIDEKTNNNEKSDLKEKLYKMKDILLREQRYLEQEKETEKGSKTKF